MLFTASLSLFLPVIAASSQTHNNKRHNQLAHRLAAPEAPVVVWNETSSIDKRGTCSGARATWYDVGLGACGKNNVPSDDIIALTHISFGGGYPGPNCFKSVTIECNGQQHGATIMDECMGCPPCGIDMSTGLFQKFSDLGAGVLTCNWWFNDGSSSPPPPPPPPPPAPKPAPAPQPKPEPKPQPKPSPQPTPTTHSTTHHSTATSQSSHAESSSSAPAVQTPTGPENIKNIFQAMLDMGQVVVGANN